jgi:hypothetical protein
VGGIVLFDQLNRSSTSVRRRDNPALLTTRLFRIAQVVSGHNLPQATFACARLLMAQPPDPMRPDFTLAPGTLLRSGEN